MERENNNYLADEYIREAGVLYTKGDHAEAVKFLVKVLSPEENCLAAKTKCMLDNIRKIDSYSEIKSPEQRFKCTVIQTELLDPGTLKNAPPEQLSLFE
jgi:hypothetical protein